MNKKQTKKFTKKVIASTFNNPMNTSPINREGSTPRFQSSYPNGDEEDTHQSPWTLKTKDHTFSPSKDVDNMEDEEAGSNDLDLMRTQRIAVSTCRT